jgi:hypothetical protein
MLPRWHILYGAIFALVLWAFAPQTGWIFLLLVFLSSFLIDFDHYVASVLKTGKLSLFESFEYHRKKGIVEMREISKGIRRKGDFHLFHTLEFHILIGLLGLLWTGFFYVFIGMVFHSLLDIYSMLNMGVFHRREYFFFNWFGKQLKR